MKEQPIRCKAHEVRAILDGSKTQKRFAIKLPHQNPLGAWESFDWGGPNGGRTAQRETVPFQKAIAHTRTGEIICCPHGQPGDRLWVRETWRGIVQINGPHEPYKTGVARYSPEQKYCKKVEFAATDEGNGEPWRPSIHMPRWASRITLEITSVRVERLQAINEVDSIAEGAQWAACGAPQDGSHKAGYAKLWEQINGSGSWDANPWVWAIEFKRVTS